MKPTEYFKAIIALLPVIVLGTACDKEDNPGLAGTGADMGISINVSESGTYSTKSDNSSRQMTGNNIPVSIDGQTYWLVEFTEPYKAGYAGANGPIRSVNEAQPTELWTANASRDQGAYSIHYPISQYDYSGCTNDHSGCSRGFCISPVKEK